jgi:hypothetical protein
MDFPHAKSESNAETVIERKDGLRAHIRLRSVDRAAAEHLAHEIEHVLEQLDDVDLHDAVARRVSGANARSGATFETTRAITVGRLVAREVQMHGEQR